MHIESAPAAENYPVTYQEKGGAAYNVDLRGEGILTLGLAERTCVFSGKQRKVLGKPVEMTVRFDEIVNVGWAGRKVVFDRKTSRGKTKPFLFYCETEEAARTVAARLPADKDEEFAATETFAGKLHSLPGGTGVSSPTNVIIGANFVVYAIMGVLGAGWFEVDDVTVYWRYGANNGAVTTNGEWWRLVSSMFLHYGVLHLLLNMWALFQIGHLLERLLGRTMFTLAYFGSGVIGSLATLIWNGDRVWSAGASGAVFGAYGMLGGYILRERRAIPRSVVQPLLKSTLMFAAYNLLFGLAHPGIDNAAHIGGLLGGVLLAWTMAMPIDREARVRLATGRFLAGMAAAASVIAIGVAASPRFNYNWNEEYAWEQALKEPLAREAGILAQQKDALEAFQSSGGTHAELIRWVNDEAVPFYEEWAAELAAMTITAGTETDERRDRLVQLMRSKIENYRQLIADVQAGDPDAAGRYYEAEKKMIERARGEEVPAR